MAFAFTESSSYPFTFALGDGVKCQIVNVTAASGDTTGTLTAQRFTRLFHVQLPTSFLHTAAPTFSGRAATLAYTVPASTAATAVIQDLTYTAVATNQSGNLVNIAYTTGGTAGSEVVTVIGNAISIQIETAVSTATQVKAAFDGSAAALALATVAISGTGSTAQTAPVAATFLTGGITGGGLGVALLYGI